MDTTLPVPSRPVPKKQASGVLVIDDEPGIRNLLSQELAAQGYQVETAADGQEAIQKIDRRKFQVALCDLNMPHVGGLEVLDAIRSRDSDLEVIMMTGYGTVETAVTAMKKGAYDFVQKPFNMDEILALVEKSLEKSEFRRVIQELKETKKRLEETHIQLIQSEKLAGIGQLAAGVAHELNNPLSGVMGFAQLLLEDDKLMPQQRKDLETIYEQSKRCRTIIQNLLQFSRRENPKNEPVQLLALLQASMELVKYDLSTSGIDLVQKLPPSLPLIFGDPHQLQQVFMNLITNARQAMEGRQKSQLLIEAKQEGDKVFVCFRDNGPGIAPEIRGKIFDPFFTTKPTGKGTGLGLSICYGIVKQHRGHLCFESEVGVGTTFAVELPVYE